jgi:hypothetical protein
VHAQYGVFGHRLDWHRDRRSDDDLELRPRALPAVAKVASTSSGQAIST